jgi:hypothetical protein
MLETKEQKQYFAGSLVLIVILTAISFWHKPNLTLKPNPPAPAKTAFDYNAYLAAIKTDPVASQKLFEQVVDEQQVRVAIEEALKTDQKIIVPTIEESKVKISSTTGKQAVAEYLTAVGQLVSNFSGKTSEGFKSLFYSTQSLSQIENLIAENDALTASLYSANVPKEAGSFNRNLLVMLAANRDILTLAKSYKTDPTVDPWPKFYNNYTVVNDSLANLQKELDVLDKKYQISQLPIYPHTAEARENIFGIKTAQAALGVGDTTIIIGNIPDAIRQALREALSAAFANFATQFLNKLITSIEDNYKIANFLYYTDALVSGQYTNDYLKKYVSNPLDRTLVTNFIPQFNCGAPKDLKEALKAKADDYLGFDPQNVGPSDPQYYSKMARIGNFLSSPDGWRLYYQDLAAQTQSEAEKAADRELLSSGLKSPRDAMGTQIAASLSTITSSVQAIMNAQLNLGVVNASEIISKLVSQVTYNLFNKFLFRGAVVYKEQSVCLAVPELKPIIPAQAAAYQDAQSVNQQQIQDQECAKSPRGCQ